ncbi:unnamed protein product [Urochloa decumbens]|uniref:DUF4220 domain-containing protein n=1 Tax=Urochloa decumbens TaxID=240449 RepID=A0ABC9BM93_9POAL
MAGLLYVWNKWQIQLLVLVSFALQLFLLIFARMRHCNISRALRILLWLVYLLADSTATYTLGHMSINSEPDNKHHRQLVAFWAPFILVHLGGQDTITAYAMADNQLWLRHLFTFTVQALGAGYAIYKNIGSNGPLVTATILMFVIGVLKNGERVWALSSSSLESISMLLDNVTIKQRDGPYYSERTQLDEKAKGLDDEAVLQGAHDLLYICMGQFVDDKVWPSMFQMAALELFHEKGSMYELIEMQLSLMYDIFYTKAAVIYTWFGCCIRAVSLLSTMTTFFLFRSSTFQDGYKRVDTVVTYTLIVGAFLLEMASILRAIGSTWMCALIKAREWDWLHRLFVSLRRWVMAAQKKSWSGSIGQHNLIDSCNEDTGCLVRGMTSLSSFWKKGSNMISISTKKLVLEEILKMVQACEGNEELMRSYRGQSVLSRPRRSIFLRWGLTWSTGIEFDASIIAWHIATTEFLWQSDFTGGAEALAEATKVLSNYMMFLAVERPYLLPSPVRQRLYVQARKELKDLTKWRMDFLNKEREDSPICAQGIDLCKQLLLNKDQTEPEGLLRLVFGLWVEMLCYAAHHCSRESHAKQLSNGGEFITVVWLVTTAEFNRAYCRKEWFKEREHYRRSLWSFIEASLRPLMMLAAMGLFCIMYISDKIEDTFGRLFS